MDNARDFVDVREMVELKKIRLTGPNAAIEGVFNGPLWYYLLVIPYVIGHGDPYGAILMEITFWAIGGFFLLKLVSEFNKFLILPVGLIWFASDYILLATAYSFNPNPLILLTPFFIFSFKEYLVGKRWWVMMVWFLAGAFFNFEMNFGIWMPLIIFSCIWLINRKYFKDNFFWLGLVIFLMLLFPQILFDFKHQFIMSKSIIKFIGENKGNTLNISRRIPTIGQTFYNVFEAIMMNQKFLSSAILILSIPAIKFFLRQGKKNTTVIICAIFILLPFIGYLIIPVTVNPWHLGGPMAASLILIGFILYSLWKINFFGKIFSIFLFFMILFYSFSNILNFLKNTNKPKMDPSLYKNETAAIDYVYQYSRGQNFKVYTYLPSVYDYPYQYLFWWYGKRKYGYVPAEYAYLPNKPSYIPSQDKFQGKKDNLSGLVFLIKEPNLNYTRFGWEGNFIKLKSIEKQMVGPMEVEIRTE